MPDVLELTMAPGARRRSTRSKSACFTSSRSTTASMIQSAEAIAGRSSSKPPVRTSAGPSGVKNGPA
jgi:hypothetical protein